MTEIEISGVKLKGSDTLYDGIKDNGVYYNFGDFAGIIKDDNIYKFKTEDSSDSGDSSGDSSGSGSEDSGSSGDSGSGGVTEEEIMASPSYISIEGQNDLYTTLSVTLSGGDGTYDVSVGSGLSCLSCTVSGSTLSVKISCGTGDWSGEITVTSGSQVLTIPVDIMVYTCLTGDTMITLADGTEKRIDELEYTDKILAIDPDTGEFVADTIIYTDSKEVKTGNHYDMHEFSDGTIIKTVHRHRFYSVDEQRMIHIHSWNVGDRAYKVDGTTPALVKYTLRIPEQGIRHYSLYTEKQNYFANGLLCGNRFTKTIQKGGN